jgi:hypothetical protein
MNLFFVVLYVLISLIKEIILFFVLKIMVLHVKARSHNTSRLNHVQSGNFWSILALPCIVWGMAVGGFSTVEALPKQG